MLEKKLGRNRFDGRVALGEKCCSYCINSYNGVAVYDFCGVSVLLALLSLQSSIRTAYRKTVVCGLLHKSSTSDRSMTRAYEATPSVINSKNNAWTYFCA